jgi:hypothetical protein
MSSGHVPVLWYDRKGFVLSGDMPVDQLHARITRRFEVRTAALATFEPTRRDGQPYPIGIGDEHPVEELAFALVGVRGDVYIYREVLD